MPIASTDEGCFIFYIHIPVHLQDGFLGFSLLCDFYFFEPLLDLFSISNSRRFSAPFLSEKNMLTVHSHSCNFSLLTQCPIFPKKAP